MPTQSAGPQAPTPALPCDERVLIVAGPARSATGNLLRHPPPGVPCRHFLATSSPSAPSSNRLPYPIGGGSDFT